MIAWDRPVRARGQQARELGRAAVVEVGITADDQDRSLDARQLRGSRRGLRLLQQRQRLAIVSDEH